MKIVKELRKNLWIRIIFILEENRGEKISVWTHLGMVTFVSAENEVVGICFKIKGISEITSEESCLYRLSDSGINCVISFLGEFYEED